MKDGRVPSIYMSSKTNLGYWKAEDFSKFALVAPGAHERREATRRSVKLPLYLYSNHCRNTVSRIIPYKEIHLLSISTAKYVTEQ